MPRTQKTDSVPVLTGYPPKNVVCARCHRRGDPREIVTPCACTDEKYMYLHRECMIYSPSCVTPPPLYTTVCPHCNTPFKEYTILHTVCREYVVEYILVLVFIVMGIIVSGGWIRIFVLRTAFEWVLDVVDAAGASVTHYMDCILRYMHPVLLDSDASLCEDWTSPASIALVLMAMAIYVASIIWVVRASRKRLDKAYKLKCNYKETPQGH